MTIAEIARQMGMRPFERGNSTESLGGAGVEREGMGTVKREAALGRVVKVGWACDADRAKYRRKQLHR